MKAPKLPTKKPKPPGTPPWRFPIWYFVLMLVTLWVWQEMFSNLTVRTIPYSQFKMHLARREVVAVQISEGDITGKIDPKPMHAGTNVVGGVSNLVSTLTNLESAGTNIVVVVVATPAGTNAPAPVSAEPGPVSPLARFFKRTPAAPSAPPTEPFVFRTVRVEDPKLVDQLQLVGVPFAGMRPGLLTQFLMAWVLPLGLMVALWIFISRKMGGASGGILSFGKSKAKLFVENATGVTFEDVAGCDEAKVELQEVVDFLKNPDRYKSLGARIPKGVLLVGPPGTGKTLLGRAVAGEAKVPFFSLSGSDFVEMFVGVGASRVRDLFVQAKAKAPCIVFIDELDAIGRQRGVHMGGGSDEREQTLNQLLVEMDGFEANVGVILLAATNRPEILDRALLRPGRFDRQVLVDAPDADGREAILKVHAKNKPLDGKVDLRRIAQATPGFSGADLANTLNEAALMAARRKVDVINQADLEEAVEKVVAGPERRGRRLNELERRRVAYHETGHALVAAHSEGADSVHKISIIPRGRAALGYTMQLPTEDQFLQTRAQLLGRIRGLLGGRAAEEIVFGEVTTGAENDLDRATALARQMVTMFGMNDRLGLSHTAQRQTSFLGGPESGPQRDCSEQTAREVDEEVKKILEEAYREAKELLTRQREQLESVTVELLRRETLDAPAFYQLIGQPVPAFPSRPTTRDPASPVDVAVAQTTPPPLPGVER